MDSVSQYPFLNRMVRAARFDRDLYRSVAADPSAMRDAALIVVAGALAAGIAVGLGAATVTLVSLAAAVLGFILSAIFNLVGWIAWAFIAWFVGTRMFNATAPFGAVARSLGFAQSPTVLRVFGFIPYLGGIIQVVVAIWILFTGFFAIRESLALSTGETLAIVIIGIVVAVPVILTLVVALGTG